MANKVNRLSKVARELNVGISTIVDFLDSKGISIESSPNTKLDENSYAILLKEYGDEKALKEAAKHKEEPTELKETITIKGNNKFSPKKEEPKPEPFIEEVKTEPIAEKVKPTPTPKKSDGPVVVDKIDLSALNLKTRPSKKAKPEKEKKTAKPVAKKVEKPATKKADPVVEIKKEKKEKEETIVEHHKTAYEKLGAPTVLGKIELPKPIPKKPKPVASSSVDPANKKKKRKRITPAGAPKIRPGGGGVGRPTGNRTGGGSRFGGKPGGPGGKREPKPELTEEQIQKQIQETLARLNNKGKNKSAKFRRTKRDDAAHIANAEIELAEIEKSILKVTEFVTANELANMMSVSVNDIISACMSLGLFVSINQRLDADTLTLVAEEFNHTIEFITPEGQVETLDEEDVETDLVERHPIVTVMGHVDHGKTSLLDHIRKANVIAGEAGGITQHIGAYEVTLEQSGKKITFLDTPGHEAFTAMRARGAKVTDIAIIVVAADDAVMPQTKEAINHAQAAEVPFIIAINKCDLPGADPEKVKTELSQMNVLVEDWGGKIQCQEVSAKKGDGVFDLLEKVLLEAEMLELKASSNKRANGTIIESSLDKGRGYLSTILVQAGTLKVGDNMLAGQYTGKVKAMFNERGQKILEAGPATPVQMLGLNGAPTAGDLFNILIDEREARDIATKRSQLSREQGVKTQKSLTLDEIGRRIAVGDFKELNVIVKGDVDGSTEALADSLQKLSKDEIQVNIIHKSVGQISDSDVLLASASQAIIIGFQVRPSGTARKIAEKEDVDIRLYSIIYDAISDVKEAMEGLLSPDIKEEIVGNIEIRETFKVSKLGTIAGCYVTDGKIGRKTTIRLIREGIVIYEGALGSLKRFKDDVAEVKAGYECGLNIEKFNDIKVGDVIEGYETREVKKKLFKD